MGRLNTGLGMTIGEDRVARLTVYNAAETQVIDFTSWSLSFIVKRNKSDDDDDAILHKTNPDGIAITGTFDASPAANTLVALAPIADSDTDGEAPGLCPFEWKRMDPGVELVLAEGLFDLRRGAHES